MVQPPHTTWARPPTRVVWVQAPLTRCLSLLLLRQAQPLTKVAYLTMEAPTVVALSVRLMEAEAQAPSLACHLASPALRLQASLRRRLATRQPRRVVSPVPASVPHRQATWRRLLRRTTLPRRHDTARPHRRRTRPHLLPATLPRLHSTPLRRQTTVPPRQPSWEEPRHQPTAPRRHSTVRLRLNTVRPVHNTNLAASACRLLPLSRPSTAPRHRAIHLLARLETSPRLRPNTALPLQGTRLRHQSSRRRKYHVGNQSFLLLWQILYKTLFYFTRSFLLDENKRKKGNHFNSRT
jgi:hypothetical protein